MEEHGLRVYENKVARRTFGKRAKEMTGRWVKLQNVEFDFTHQIIRKCQIKESGISGTCSMGGRDYKCV
jgi:hypothetical protein